MDLSKHNHQKRSINGIAAVMSFCMPKHGFRLILLRSQRFCRSFWYPAQSRHNIMQHYSVGCSCVLEEANMHSHFRLCKV